MSGRSDFPHSTTFPLRSAALFIATAGLALSGALGCAGPTKAEYAAFVQASRDFYGDVAPLCSEALAAPFYQDGAGAQVKKNHVGELKDYGLALDAAFTRLK